MGKGKRSREPGTKRRTILQIDSNKIASRSNVSPPRHEEMLPVPEPVDDQLAEFLKEISALEEENKLKSETPTTDIQQEVPSDAQVSTVNQTELPEGWQRVLDNTTGYHYYWHVATNETSWEVPSVKQLTTQSNEARENPAGLSLISAYSETDSDNSPPALRKEVENDRETHSIPQPIATVAQPIEDPSNTLNTTQDNTLPLQPTTSNHGHKVANTINTIDSYQPIMNYYKLPLIHAFTQTEDNMDIKPTDDALRPLIQQLVAEVKHKLEFLGINLQQVNQLQGMLIELETRVNDWRAGYLPSEYTLTRLQESTRVLREYEQSAAPVGWGCTWDPNQQKYQYIQTSSGRTVWEYSSAVAVSSEVLGDEDMVLSGSEDGECPPLPPLPTSPTSGPPPPPADVTNQSADLKFPIEPPLPSSTPQPASIQSSNPPLPDLPPSESSSPPPLPIIPETTPAIPPPLPPNNSPLPPCPDIPVSPLPPSDNSDMSHSPATRSPPTKPNSPLPPLQQDTSSSQHVIPPQYYPQQDQQQLVYTYYNPTNSANYDAYSQATYLQHQYTPPAIESPKSPQSSGKAKIKKSSSSNAKKIPPSSLSTHAVSLKKKGIAGMLEKWQQLHTVEASSEDSDSEIEEESSLKDRIAEWKKEQLVSGKAKENANFHNIHGNWKDKIKRAKQNSTADSSLLHLSQPTEG
ncbi:Formin-binding protein 4-like [Oopsacas minuta]|uniref:Formin-binding protein 4-like n=1 Tax=Oopsacas minuta TaxID=111878 RepID=A0AAV7JSY3_9METZ|nr:Formin-binding protein 4-like [Oopsacas minuta]